MHEHEHDHATRREVLKGIGVTAGAAAASPFLSSDAAEALAQVRSGAAATKLRFFTRAPGE